MMGGGEARMRVTVVVVSDRCSRGEAEDTAGKALAQLVKQHFGEGAAAVRRVCVPDEVAAIQRAITAAAHQEASTEEATASKPSGSQGQTEHTGGSRLVVTAGGTGCAPRDVTPEAVAPLLTKPLPGIDHLLTSKSLTATPMAALSRFCCGVTAGGTLVLTFPGSEKACRECFGFVTPVLNHALDSIADCTARTAAVHKAMQHQHHHHRREHDQAHGHAQAHHHVCPHKKHHGHKHGHDSASKGSVADRDRKSPWSMLNVDAAMEHILKFGRQRVRAEQMAGETVSLQDALGRVLANNIHAQEPHPRFPASIKDGYAVRVADCPGTLTVDGPITAGDTAEEKRVLEGHAIRVTTGAPVPTGTEAVIQVEDTELVSKSEDGEEEASIRVLKSVTEGQDIRPVGFDIQQGELVLRAGDVIGPAELGLLATVGCTQVLVHRCPLVGVISTGDEIVDAETTDALHYGQVRDSNRVMLISALKECGVRVHDFGVVSDTVHALKEKLREMSRECDVVITSGGVSMGEKDLIKSTITDQLGGVIHFGRVFMRPGKPTTFAAMPRPDSRSDDPNQEVAFFGLPGNPVSCLVTFHLFVTPLLRMLRGLPNASHQYVHVRTDMDLHLNPRPEFHRAMLSRSNLDGVAVAVSTGSQCSSRLLSMRSAHCLLALPPQSEEQQVIPKGQLLPAILLPHVS